MATADAITHTAAPAHPANLRLTPIRDILGHWSRPGGRFVRLQVRGEAEEGLDDPLRRPAVLVGIELAVEGPAPLLVLVLPARQVRQRLDDLGCRRDQRSRRGA